jgi:lysylphosphatidylglycerol synthetase-like protein (DUF2156 family)
VESDPPSYSMAAGREVLVPVDYRRYLIGQSVVGAAINAILNAAIGWGLYRELSRVPLRGQQSIAADIIATSLLLPILVCLIATPLIRAEVRKARLPAADWVGPARRSFRLPRRLLFRALTLGVLCALLIAPAVIWLLNSLGLDGLEFGPFLAFKGGFAAALAAVVTPIVAAFALRDGLYVLGRSQSQPANRG